MKLDNALILDVIVKAMNLPILLIPA